MTVQYHYLNSDGLLERDVYSPSAKTTTATLTVSLKHTRPQHCMTEYTNNVKNLKDNII